MSGAPGSLRARFEEIAERAARAGVSGTERFFRMTPREIGLCLTAAAEAERRCAEREDRAAWLAGYYTGFAVHAPGKYPRRPQAACRPETAMTEEAMKNVFRSMARPAARGETEEKV